MGFAQIIAKQTTSRNASLETLGRRTVTPASVSKEKPFAQKKFVQRPAE